LISVPNAAAGLEVVGLRGHLLRRLLHDAHLQERERERERERGNKGE
jgi:hypothetical protein